MIVDDSSDEQSFSELMINTVNQPDLLSVHKFNNLDETDQFLERYNLQKLKQVEIDALSRLISIKEV